MPAGKELYRHQGFFAKEDILKKWQELGVDLTQVAESRRIAMSQADKPAEVLLRHWAEIDFRLFGSGRRGQDFRLWPRET